MIGNIGIGVIGGSGLEKALEGEKYLLETPYGEVNLKICSIEKRKIAFIPRHGERHELPPHKINYKGNIWAFKKIGVERIIATNAVGGIREGLNPGDLLIPHDFIDFTKSRSSTFYDKEAIHIDVTNPYCPELRGILIETANEISVKTWGSGVYVCTEGPRFETPSEIKMFRLLGADVVGMTGIPEVVLARELKICYATICIVTNYAAGMQKRITQEEVNEIMKMKVKTVLELIRRAILKISVEYKKCECWM
ncbi:MAG: S-methyl-5'-thioadenosine phosphorylase [Candidatus Methanomethylicia archaeon]|nr:S-methyl-5'-thioadenosine phosphorylase [Candidatus Methanomethylicia archaeon]MCX8169211.1 S-methyl-5'-thioadenosine phosphorylase [Candidatus Methanomethylicia archaeon]MDW7989007.1 S-methyl-5'-thioadenosine phosphorylase [Nitrososphaerota archaeon]